jgi:predicted unusual protein kinase regulating ubiquinone biosynthesis (AarF/ABC1/UbiB family)
MMTSNPIKDATTELVTALAELGKRVAKHVDGLTQDLVRDAGRVARSGQAFGRAAREQWDDVAERSKDAWARTRSTAGGAPRAARVVTAGLGVVAHARLLRMRGLAAGREALTDDDHRALAARVRELCVDLRGGVLKLGQIVSARPDLVGAAWAGELSSLQDRVPPIESTAIVARIEEELGQTILDAFGTFESDPVAAASLAQVHKATLEDGTVVAVKVQIPGIDEVIQSDIAALRILAGVLGDVLPMDLRTIADELERALTTELDYLAEAIAGTRFAKDVAGTALFAPAVIDSHSTPRVLTTTFVEGARLTDALDAAAPDERARIVTALCDGLARQVFRTGHIHADPHPGNFLVTADGRIAVLDFGCTLVLTPEEKRGYARLLAALAMRDEPTALVELAALGFGGKPEALAIIAHAITQAMKPGELASEIDWERQGRELVGTMMRVAKDAGITIPPSFVLLGRVLGTMAGLVATYKPPIQLHAVIAPHLAAALGQQRSST